MAFTNYTIVPVDSVVVIDGVAYNSVDMSGIPDTVHAIQWNGVTGAGSIEYKQLPDGTLPAPGSFSDPADYYNQTEACVDPLVCYATSSSSVYAGQTYFIGQQLAIRQYPQPAIPAGFTAVAPSAQTLSYTSLFWNGSVFVWSLFDPTGTLADGRSTSIDYVNSDAYSILQPSDWYVVRQSENGTPIPESWNTWRQLIRQEANTKNAGIAACASIDELLAYTTAPAFNTWTPSPA
jgi:hypothetical protein